MIQKVEQEGGEKGRMGQRNATAVELVQDIRGSAGFKLCSVYRQKKKIYILMLLAVRQFSIGLAMAFLVGAATVRFNQTSLEQCIAEVYPLHTSLSVRYCVACELCVIVYDASRTSFRLRWMEGCIARFLIAIQFLE